MLASGISVELLDTLTPAGTEFPALWRVDGDLVDADASGTIEAGEVSQVLISLDALGLIDNHVEFRPVLGENAFVSLEGDLMGIADIPVPANAPANQQFEVWMTVEIGIADLDLAPASAENAASVFSFLESVVSFFGIGTEQGLPEPVEEFVNRFSSLGGGDVVGWLNDYATSMYPSLLSQPDLSQTREFIVEKIAEQGVANDKAIVEAPGGPRDIVDDLPEIVSDAYGGNAKFWQQWDPTKSTVVLVHGIQTEQGNYFNKGDSMQTLFGPQVNVLSFYWGRTGVANGLLRTVASVLATANDPDFVDTIIGFIPSIGSFYGSARVNLEGSVDLHLLLKLLGRAYDAAGEVPGDNIHLVAHSQGTVVTAAALALNPPGAETYDIGSTIFVGANLHQGATQGGREFSNIDPHLLDITSYYSAYDHDVLLGGGVAFVRGAGNAGFAPNSFPGVISVDAVAETSRNGFDREIEHTSTTETGKIGWWDWLLFMEEERSYLSKRFGLTTTTASLGEYALAELRTGGAAVDFINGITYVPVPDWFDFPIGGIQQRSPGRPLPTEPIVPPSILSVLANPDPAFRGELLVATANGASAAAGRQLVRADFYLDLNHNGFPDSGEHLESDHDARGGWRVAIDTTDLAPGVHTLLTRVADDHENHSPIVSTVIEIIEPGSPPSELPNAIDSTFIDIEHQIVPHENGDIRYAPEFQTVGPGKVDFWAIRPATSGGFDFTTTGSTDTVMGLYDRATGALIDFDTDNGPGGNAQIVATLIGGTEYVLAIAGENSAAGTYGLDVIGVDQTLTATIAVPSPFYQATTPGAISGPYDTHYFKVIVPGDATSLDVRLDPSAFLDGFVRVENASNLTIRTALQAEASFDDVILAMPVVGGETLYITVTGTLGTTGTYDLKLDFNPDDSGVPDELTPVPTTVPLVPFPWGVAQALDASIGVPGEFDYYLFAPRSGEGGDFTFETLGETDTQIGIYRYLGPSQAVLEFQDDDSGAGENARIEASLNGGDRYVVLVRAEGTSTGAYDLMVNGPSNSVQDLVPSGLTLTRSSFFDGFTQDSLYQQFRVLAPATATTVSIETERNSGVGNDTLDVALRVADADGNVLAWIDDAGPGLNEQLSGLAVEGGGVYYVTLYGETPAIGSARIHIDFDPDFQITEGVEFPINSTTLHNQRAPDVATNAAGQSVAAWTSRMPSDFDIDVVFQRFDASGAVVGPETLANTPDGNVNQGPPAIGIDASGNFVIAWETAGDVVFRRFSAAGAPLGGEVATGLAGATSIDIAVQANGAFMIVASDDTSLQGRLFDTGGNPLTPTLLLDDTPDDVEHASVSADGTGNYVVAWNVSSDGFLVEDVYAMRIDSAGDAISSGRHSFVAGEVRSRRFQDSNGNGVQDIGEAGVAGVTLLLDANGNSVQDGGELTQITNSDGDYVFSGVPVGVYHVVQVGGPASGPAVLLDDFDRADSSDLGPDWVEQLGDLRVEGNRLRSQLGTGGKSTSVYQPFDGARQAVTFDLNYDLAAGERIVAAQAYLAYADPQHYVSVNFLDNSIDGQSQFRRVFFGFTDDWSLTDWPRMRGGPQFVDVAPFSSARILAAYDPISSTLTVGIDRDFDGVYETVLTRGGILPDGLGTKVAIGGFNNVAIDNFTVDTSWQVMPPSSAAPTEAFRVAPEQTQSQGPPDVAAHPDGTFVVAFEANDTDGSGRNIYVQRFDANGQTNGPLSRANSLVDGDQIEPTVAIISQGKFLVGWTTDDSNAKGVAVRLFDVAGVPSGPEFLINEYETDNQQRLALASDGDNQYVGVWESNWQDLSLFGIFGRGLTVGTLLESELAVVDSSGPSEDRFVTFDTADAGGAFVATPATHSVQTVVIRNDGNRALTVTGLDVYGQDAAFFSLNDDTGFTLQPEEFRELTVDFLATTSGEYFSALRIFHDDAADALSGQFDANPYWISLLGSVLPTDEPVVLVVGRHIFYNNSFYDGNDTGINASDDAAIDTGKSALLPGGTGAFLNTTPYTNGINGVMVDLVGTGGHTSISATDFVFKVGNNNTPGTWAAAPAPTAVSARLGAGVSGSDRVEITWADGAITNTWLEVQVLANSDTGLDDSFYGGGIGDVFFFGNVVADSNNLATDLFDAFPIFTVAHPPSPAVTYIYDYTKDGAVDLSDAFPVFLGGGGAIVALTVPSGGPFAQVVGRHIFYNGSGYDGGSTAINASDDLAIDTSKSALLPGGTGAFANATPYTKGINGIMIDLAGGGSHASITATDFIFKVGNDNTPGSWAAAPATLAVSTRLGAGVSGSDRVEITWADGAITNTWLEVQVLANGNTGLADIGGGIGDVFFFGNKVADSNNLATDLFDAFPIFTVAHPPSPAVTYIYDYDKSGAVDLFDAFPVFSNGGAIVALTVPSGGPFAPGGGDVSPATAGGGDAGISSGLVRSLSSEKREALPAGVSVRLDGDRRGAARLVHTARYAQLLEAAVADVIKDSADLGAELLDALAGSMLPQR